MVGNSFFHDFTTDVHEKWYVYREIPLRTPSSPPISAIRFLGGCVDTWILQICKISAFWLVYLGEFRQKCYTQKEDPGMLVFRGEQKFAPEHLMTWSWGTDFSQLLDSGEVNSGYRVLKGGGVSKGRGCSWGTLRIPREFWGTLGNIRETPPLGAPPLTTL